MADLKKIQDVLNTTPDARTEFAEDPQAFLNKHGLSIDQATTEVLKKQMSKPGVNANAVSVGVTVGT